MAANLAISSGLMVVSVMVGLSDGTRAGARDMGSRPRSARIRLCGASPQYEHHLREYGHPADVGFIEIQRRWTAENWDPDDLLSLYKAAGARYFVAMANHHDNFDAWDSRWHDWNSVRLGPKRDIIGT